MKRFFPCIVFAFRLPWIACELSAAKELRREMSILAKFGKIPVLVAGALNRWTPLRAILVLIIHGKQNVALRMGKQLSAIQWLTDVSSTRRSPINIRFRRAECGGARLIRLGTKRPKYFSFAELTPFLETD
jgi:hypothetical protein